MRDHITPAALTALLNLLKLQAQRSGYNPQASHDFRVQHENKARILGYAQDTALPILRRLCHDTAGKQAFAAAGGVQILVAGAAKGADWFSEDSDSAGLCLLCDLTKEPAVVEAVVQAGAVKVLLNELHPHGVDELDTYLAASALARPAATALGRTAIAAAPRGIKSILKSLAATYTDRSPEAGFLFQGLSMCLFHLAQNADSRDALHCAGGVPPYISHMLKAGLDEQQAKRELCDRCLAHVLTTASFMEAVGFDPHARSDSDSDSD